MKILNFQADMAKITFPKREHPIFLETLFSAVEPGGPPKKILLEKVELDASFKYAKNLNVILFSYHGTNVICVERLSHISSVSSYRYAIKFYSAFFTLIQNSAHKVLIKILDGLNERYKKTSSVTRLDIALDIDVPIDELIEASGFKTKLRNNKTIGTLQKKETVYFGSTGGSNKRYFIRVYDKLADTRAKNKFAIVGEKLLKNPVLTRVEVQINSQVCRELGVSISSITDLEKLKSYFKTLCISESNTYFPHLDCSDFEKIEITEQIPVKPENTLNPDLKAARRLRSAAKKLKEKHGIDPVDFLASSFDTDEKNDKRDSTDDDVQTVLSL